jgi:hypothetical protein
MVTRPTTAAGSDAESWFHSHLLLHQFRDWMQHNFWVIIYVIFSPKVFTSSAQIST